MKGSSSKIGFILIALVLSIGAVMGGTMWMTYSNKYVDLTAQYEAQVDVDKVVYDEVWKTISQQAGVSEKYSEDFRKNYTSIMTARNYGGEMMKWITEQNPTFDPSLYSKLMNTIEAKRAEFTENQKRLVSIRAEIEKLVRRFPSSIFVGHRPIPDIVLVTSTRTDGAFTSGKDDDVGLFKSDSASIK